MENVESVLRKLVTGIGHAINAANDAANVIVPLRCLASLLRDANVRGKGVGGSTGASPKALDEMSSLCREEALHAFPLAPSEQVLSRAFYGGSCFIAMAQLLLHKVAVDWLACFSLMEQTMLFDDFFTHAPLSEAVSVLVQGLRVEQVSEDDESYTTVDSHSAACSQAERLLVLIFISGQGVKKLCLLFSSPTEVLQETGPYPSVSLASYRLEISQLAQLLSSIPDRASLQAPTALQSPFYIQSVVSQLLDAAEENWTLLSTNGSCPQVSDSDVTLMFIGEVIGGLCRRGHADIIASQIVPSLMKHLLTAPTTHGADSQHSYSSLDKVINELQLSMWPSLAESITDSHALERLSEALIKEIATTADVTDWQAYCCLHTLYGKLLKERVSTRSLFIEKFLFGKILPIQCLKWVLDFAILCSPPTSEHRMQLGKNESKVNKDVVRRLAGMWATKDFIQSASVQHQAYLTAALGICLGSMNKDVLEGTNNLVPSLLKGISNRLDSPLNPIRLMAKRIALAFSTVVDSGSPLLFDEDYSVEDLLNWEGLEQLPSQNLRISDHTELGRKQIAGKVEKGLDDDEQQGVYGYSNDQDQRHARRKLRKAKEEKLALEEDDPDAVVRLGEGGNLDEESEESSKSGSDSESTLQPYSMSDDEADVGRGKFVTQLADLAINLRKGDRPDAVVEALQVAEKLILAMPEELDNLAADLTHALLHVKCGVVAIEGEEDIAEERRHRSLVALLCCSPLQTVSVLTTQLFSQHVDASQRILILDVMTAGARVLASGSQGSKSSDVDRWKRLVTNVPETIDHSSWHAPGAGSGSSRTGAGPWVKVTSPVPGGTLVGWGHRYERELPHRPGHRPLGRSRRWGQRAMQLREDESVRKTNLSHANGFAPLAVAFMLPVMRDYDKKRQGLEILGRDFLVLGGILSMLGVCIECISMQKEAAVVGAGLLEMLRSREISSHSETFVRRTALFAASRVLAALHPSDVVASLTTGVSSIVANLEWVREWALEIAINDMDADCSMMATACVQLHSEMALQVQRSIGSLEPSGRILEPTIQPSLSIIMPF